MKIHLVRRVTIVFAFVLLLCAVAQARYIMWQPKDKPPVSLAQAMPLAQAALGKDGNQFWCVDAKIAKTDSEGDWQFTYSNKKGEITYVFVGSDRKVWVHKMSQGPLEF